MLTHKLELTSNEDICSVYFYKYNSRNQLVEEYHYGYNNLFDYLYVFEYDNYGNIVFKKEKDVNNNIIHSFEYYYDTNNPYLLIMVKLDNEIIYNIEYHAHKKLYPSKITKNGEEFNLTWEENRLKSFGNCSFYYNYDGTRTRLTNNQYVKDFVSFNNNVYSVIKTEINNPENSVEINYIFDEQSVVRGFKLNNKFYYFERDILGNINKIIDINNIVYVEYKYDSYGKPTIIVPTELSNELKTIAEIISCNNIYLYRGYIYDVETNLFLVSSRYYSPELCRWISPDDIEYLDPESVNGLNLYCYCFNNPINYIDPDGHFPWLILAALLLFTPVGGTALQVATSAVSYVGMSVWALGDLIFNEGKGAWADMCSIKWNPFNTNETATLNSNYISFYKGVPVFRTNMDRSGSFGAIFLRRGWTDSQGNFYNLNDPDELRHERGHNSQLMRMGIANYGLMIGLPSWQEWSTRSYYDRPWEITADVFGGVTGRTHSQADINRGYWYLGVSSLFGPLGYFFLIGEY